MSQAIGTKVSFRHASKTTESAQVLACTTPSIRILIVVSTPDTTATLKELHSAVKDINTWIEDSATATSPSLSISQGSWPSQDFNSASISALERIASSVNAVGDSLKQSREKRPFGTPRTVDIFYTGREREASQLATWLLQSQQSEKQKQRRFVVYGVGKQV